MVKKKEYSEKEVRDAVLFSNTIVGVAEKLGIIERVPAEDGRGTYSDSDVFEAIKQVGSLMRRYEIPSFMLGTRKHSTYEKKCPKCGFKMKIDK
jgi:hypothetical protein